VSGPPDLLVSHCGSCQGRFLPRPGPCPYCGSREIRPEAVPGEGKVLAAIELESPAAGLPAPHRLVLVELAASVRVLAIAPGPVPARETTVRVERDGAIYRIVPRST
jgi:uncharacterized OB-fold protein